DANLIAEPNGALGTRHRVPAEQNAGNATVGRHALFGEPLDRIAADAIAGHLILRRHDAARAGFYQIEGHVTDLQRLPEVFLPGRIAGDEDIGAEAVHADRRVALL